MSEQGKRVSEVIAAGLLGITSPLGRWSATDPPQAFLEFHEDGRLTGNDGCNAMVGSWDRKGTTVSFHQVASTRMFCMNVDMWLTGLHTGQLSGKTLSISNADGNVIGVLTRETGTD